MAKLSKRVEELSEVWKGEYSEKTSPYIHESSFPVIAVIAPILMLKLIAKELISMDYRSNFDLENYQEASPTYLYIQKGVKIFDWLDFLGVENTDYIVEPVELKSIEDMNFVIELIVNG